MVTYLERLLPIKSYDYIIQWIGKIRWQTNNPSPQTQCLWTKLGRMVSYLGWLLPIMSHDHTITWSSDKIITHKLPQCLLLRSLRSFLAWNHKALWSRGLARSPKRLDIFYLSYHKAYDHQTWQADEFLWEGSTHKATQPLGHVVMWDHVVN